MKFWLLTIGLLTFGFLCSYAAFRLENLPDEPESDDSDRAGA